MKGRDLRGRGGTWGGRGREAGGGPSQFPRRVRGLGPKPLSPGPSSVIGIVINIIIAIVINIAISAQVKGKRFVSQFSEPLFVPTFHHGGYMSVESRSNSFDLRVRSFGAQNAIE